MILVVKNKTNNEEKQYLVNNWQDLKELVIDYKGLEQRLEKVRNFDEVKREILQFFDNSSYLKATFAKQQSVAEAGKPLAKSNPLLYAEKFHGWLELRAQEARQETKPTGKDEADRPEEPKPTFIDKVRRMFGL